MEIFDPPQLKPKASKRVLFRYPEGINRKLFVWIYFGSIFFWLLVILGVGTLIVFVLLPFLGVVLSSINKFLFMIGFFATSIVFGMSMGSKVVNGIIIQGVAAGEIEINK